MRERRAALVCCAAWLAACGVARADDRLVDPTAPPASIANAAHRVEPKTAAPLQLQSVLISGARRVAVIDGRRVRVGDAVGGAVVAAIEPTEVRLDGPAGAVRLPLHRTQAKEPVRSAGKALR